MIQYDLYSIKGNDALQEPQLIGAKKEPGNQLTKGDGTVCFEKTLGACMQRGGT